MRLLLSVGLLLTATLAARAQDALGRPISPWQPGMLDIHQIRTGRGNAGHIVLRVAPGGESSRMVIVDDSAESWRVTKVFGPYAST